MAEAILSAKELPGVQVRSAGIFAGESPLSTHAQTVLDSQGISFAHSSKQLRAEDMEWATHVLAMTESHRKILLQNFPEYATKIYTLKEFANGSTADVSDPYGGSLSAYEHTFDELHGLISQVAVKLNGKIDN
jgi:protein-tyrosine phosphatase